MFFLKEQLKIISYKDSFNFALETLTDESLKKAVKECCKNGIPVRGFFTTNSIIESATISLQITKENENKVLNILKCIEDINCLNVVFCFDEQEQQNIVRIFANMINKSKVFQIVKEASRKKCDVLCVSKQLQEIYLMHKKLVVEDISHQIKYNKGKIIHSMTIKGISSYFNYGVDRVKNIYQQNLWTPVDGVENDIYEFRYRNKSSLLNKVKKINSELEKEFKWQANELEELSKKYRRDPIFEDSDMLKRMAKVRDEFS